MTVSRLALMVILNIGVLSALPGAEAQQAARIPSVGILRHGTSDKTVGSLNAFRQGLRELGYVEGQSIALEYRFSGQKVETMPALAADLVRLKVDVLYAGGLPAIIMRDVVDCEVNRPVTSRFSCVVVTARGHDHSVE